jgi:hypothetical protein
MTEPRDPIERIEAALSRLGEEHEPPAGWEARVLAAAAPPRKRPWWLFAAGPALAAAVVILLVVIPRKPPPAFAVAVDVEKGPVAVRGDRGDTRGSERETTAHLGDIVHARASAGAGHRALWIYHEERELVIACPGAPECKTTDDALTADLPIARIGAYQIVGVSSSAELPSPTGNYDADVAAAERVNALVSQYKVTVR